MKQKQSIDNKKQRLQFGKMLSAKVEGSPSFLKNVIFSDEAQLLDNFGC